MPLLKEAIESLSRAAESREMQTAGHGDLVARYTEVIARALGLSSEETADLVYAARVHDVGKIFVPEHILNKPGPLSDDEFFAGQNARPCRARRSSAPFLTPT